MGMAVDKAGGDDVTFRVDNLFRGIIDFADRRDPSAADRNVRAIAWQSRAVDDGAVTNDDIV